MGDAGGGREHLVIVLPGIGGSVLAEPGRLDAPLWDAGVGSVVDILTNPRELDIDRELVPVGLIKSLKLFGVWTPIRGYDGLLTALGRLPNGVVHGGHPDEPWDGVNVVAFPYDFRRSVAEAAAKLDDVVRERLAQLWAAEYTRLGVPITPEPRPRVVVIAHSMGGLVARYWLAQAENWRLCRMLITLGTPHRGAPKALDTLVNGVPVRKGLTVHLDRPVPTLRRWPGAYELLPRYPMIEDRRSREPAKDLLRPYELDDERLEWLSLGATAAWEMHRCIQDGWAKIPFEERPVVEPRIGYGHGTLQQATWDGHRLRVGRRELSGIGEWAKDRGDGTVPAVSGLPIEMGNESGVGLRVPLTHSGIVDLEEVTGLVEKLEGRPPTRHLQGDDVDPEHPVVLGVDVADVVIAGDEVEADARILGTRENTSRVAVFATLTALDAAGRRIPGATQPEVRLDRDGDGWAGALAVVPPGAYRLRVSADAIPAGGSAVTERVVQVVDLGVVE